MDNSTDIKSQEVDRLAHAKRFAAKNDGVRGAVYFIQCNEFTKIGFAFDVPSRLCNLQTGCPYELKLLRSIPLANPDKVEEEIHSQLEQYRTRGEWFILPAEILAEYLTKNY